jgi:hypothetical protein
MQSFFTASTIEETWISRMAYFGQPSRIGFIA